MVYALLVAASLTQTPAQAPSAAPKKNQPITMTGCVSPTADQSRSYTFLDETGVKYRLSGKDVKKFAGQKVEIVGGRTAKLAVRGGLYPSPNVAAQAGALDPAQAAIAAQPGGGSTGTGAELPEFKVTALRALSGACR